MIASAQFTISVVNDGKNGNGIVSHTIEYQVGTSATTPPTGTWSDTPVATLPGEYLWVKNTLTYNEGEPSISYSVSAHGKSVKSVKEQYYLSSSNTEQKNGTWVDACPSWQKNKYIWTRTKMTWDDNSVTYSDPVLSSNLNDMSQAVSDLKTTVSSQGTSISTIQGQIESNVWLSDIELAIDALGNVDTTLTGKYSTLAQKVDGFKSTISETYATKSGVTESIENLQAQIDGAIETFTGNDEPTLTNTPASTWTTNAIKKVHIGDLYIVNSTNTTKGGFYYRFTNEGTDASPNYKWVLLKDSEVTKALADAAAANERAQGAIDELHTKYSTTEQITTNINQKADEVTLNVKRNVISQYLGSVAPNLLCDSDRESVSAVTGPANRYFSDSSNSSIIMSTQPCDDSPCGTQYYIRTRATNVPNSKGRGYCFYSQKGVLLIPGEIYTASWWVKGDITNGSFKMQFQYGETNYKQETISTYSVGSFNWTKVSCTFEAPEIGGYTYDDGSTRIYFGKIISATEGSSGIFYMTGFKLEKGSVATDWSPSPSDSLNILKNAELTINDSGISSIVSSNDKGEAISSLINQSASNVVIKADKIDLSGRVSIDTYYKDYNEISGKVLTNEGDIKTKQNANSNLDKLVNKIDFDENGIKIGNVGNDYMTIGAGNIDFYSNGRQEPQVQIDDDKINIKNGTFENTLRIGNCQFIPHSNGSLSLVFVGDD